MGGGEAVNSKHTQTQTHTHTHTVSTVMWMEPRAIIGSNLDTCRRGPPLIKLIGYEEREDTLEVEGAGKGKHTHIHTQCPS